MYAIEKALVHESFSVNMRVYKKIENVLRGFSVLFFKFYIWFSRLLSQKVENNSVDF